MDPIIFYNFFGTYVPFASLNKLGEQIPFIKKRFQKYTALGEVNTVEQLTGKNPKEYLQTNYINELRSIVYLNTPGGFKGIPLPNVAQQSSIKCFLIDPKKKTLSFESHKSFNLPKSKLSRAVEFLKNNQFVISTQNSFVFLATSK